MGWLCPPRLSQKILQTKKWEVRELIWWLLHLLFLPAWALNLKQNKQANISISPAGGKASVLRPLGYWSRWVRIMGLGEPL